MYIKNVVYIVLTSNFSLLISLRMYSHFTNTKKNNTYTTRTYAK